MFLHCRDLNGAFAKGWLKRAFLFLSIIVGLQPQHPVKVALDLGTPGIIIKDLPPMRWLELLLDIEWNLTLLSVMNPVEQPALGYRCSKRILTV